MPPGIACAPTIFQRLMDQLTADLPFCDAYLDDLIVTPAPKNMHVTFAPFWPGSPSMIDDADWTNASPTNRQILKIFLFPPKIHRMSPSLL
uniref:Reverse transcriptase domain-containing protein n=1 Tax=Steinernema glaseri TaxID=37863 RepID=A0A1I7YU51_9BILA